MTMKAIVCEEFGPLDKLVYREIDDPRAKDHTVVIRPQAIGINYPDGLLVQGLYQVKPPTPFVPGMEVAGIVESDGPEQVPHIGTGPRDKGDRDRRSHRDAAQTVASVCEEVAA